MRGVGYISGHTLSQIQEQWEQLINAEVNVILFDRHLVSLHFDQANPSPHAREAQSMWRYMETMRAGQAIAGNKGNYQVLEDLQPGETLVLTDLDTLTCAEPGLWGRIYARCTQGVHLAILSNGFHSASQFGDAVLAMQNSAFVLGTLAAQAEQSGNDPTQAQDILAAVYAYLGDPHRRRFKVAPCDGIPDGWYRTFDPTGRPIQRQSVYPDLWRSPCAGSGGTALARLSLRQTLYRIPMPAAYGQLAG